MVETFKMALGCKWMLVEPRAGPGFQAEPSPELIPSAKPRQVSLAEPWAKPHRIPIPSQSPAEPRAEPRAGLRAESSRALSWFPSPQPSPKPSPSHEPGCAESRIASRATMRRALSWAGLRPNRADCRTTYKLNRAEPRVLSWETSSESSRTEIRSRTEPCSEPSRAGSRAHGWLKKFKRLWSTLVEKMVFHWLPS